MDSMLQHGQEVLKNQPFSQLLGAELTAFEEGYAELRLDLKDELKQQHGFAHGGVVSYLADNALTYAGGSMLGNVVTLEYKINYSRPATGDYMMAKASVLSSGKTTAVCECRITAYEGTKEKLVAVAQGTIYKIDTA